jgi:glycosyltransferase involved in cell wall biosynthesis
VVTPSFNQCHWLKRCVASVRDQVIPGSIRVHHHIQDACSTDGTREWLLSLRDDNHPDGYELSFSSEPDHGMYDAINRGWRAAAADVDIVAHINCDEQYLPGALSKVAAVFENKPEAELLLADILVVDAEGQYVCHRRSLKPYALLSRFCCAGSTASTFHRISVTRQKEAFFDTSWRNLADKVWYYSLHKVGVKFCVLNVPVATFAITGANLNWTNEGLREKKRYEEEYQFGSHLPGLVASKLNACRRILKEWCMKPPAEYAIYGHKLDTRKVSFIERPRGLWHKKWPSWSAEQNDRSGIGSDS